MVVEGRALGQGKLGQKIPSELELEAAAPGNFNGILQRFRKILEKGRHLLRRAQVLLLAVVTGAARIGEHPSFMNADAGLVCLEIVGAQKSDIVCGDHGDTEPRGDVDRGLNAELFRFTTRSLQLDVITLGKQRQPTLEAPFGLACPLREQQLADISGDTGRERDQAIGVFFEPLPPHRRGSAALALGIAPRDQPA